MPSFSSGRRERWVTALVCSFVLAAGTARADSADEMAHKHFESGAAYLEQADYESALREFTAAYNLSKRAEVLLNVATVYERMNKLQDAVGSLEQYLAADPQGEHAETVKIRIENLKKRISAEPAPAPASAPPPASSPPPSPSPSTTPAPAAHSSKTPAYVLRATGGALAIGSVVTGIMAKSEHSNAEKTCSPNCSD